MDCPDLLPVDLPVERAVDIGVRCIVSGLPVLHRCKDVLLIMSKSSSVEGGILIL